MRLQEVRMELEKRYMLLSLDASEGKQRISTSLNSDLTIKKSTDDKVYIIKNWQEQTKLLVSLANDFAYLTDAVESIFDVAAPIKNYQTISSKSNNIMLTSSEYQELKSQYQRLLGLIASNIAFVSEFVPSDTEQQINIYLPTDMTIGKNKKILDNLDFILNKCMVVKEANEGNEAVISAVDSGSIWLLISLAAGAVTLVGRIAKMALAVRRELIQQDAFKEQARIYAANADVEKGMAKALNDMCNEYARTVIDEEKLDIKPAEKEEKINNLAKGIEMMGRLMHEGVGIYPSLEANKETLDAFPPEKEMNQITSKAKQYLIDKDSKE